MPVDSPLTSFEIRSCPWMKGGSKCGLREGLKRSGIDGGTCRREADGGSGSLDRGRQISGWCQLVAPGRSEWFEVLVLPLYDRRPHARDGAWCMAARTAQ